MLSILLGGVVPISLLIVGYVIGSGRERSHLQSLEDRERRYANVLQVNVRSLPENWSVKHAGLVQGQAVIATDYFKSFRMKVRNFFGGEARGMQTLMQRARREAQVRMVEEAVAIGANAVWNVRIETSEMSQSMGNKGATIAEAYAYGTALTVQTESSHQDQ
jgi:uncharacterized protein YbjQ (UPF0145 family)